MATRYYPAILGAVTDGLSVSFPDFPGLASFGATHEAAAAAAEEGLALHIAGMIEDGDTIPDPTPLDAVQADPEGGPEAGRLLVRAELPGKAVRINITLDEGLLALADSEAKRRDTSRSGLIAAALRREISQQAGR
jgi:predicted RNase H-like HicB family nuclease